MKANRLWWLVCVVGLVSVSCDEEGGVVDLLEPERESESVENGISLRPVYPEVLAERANYTHIVRDSDGWEIMLNLGRRTYSSSTGRYVYGYTGHLFYKSGRYLRKGYATASYDPVSRVLGVMALDSSRTTDMIGYTFVLPESGTYLGYGTYYYYKFSRRINLIRGDLIKGTFGAASSAPSSAPGAVVPAAPLTTDQLRELDALAERKHEEREEGGS